MGIKSNVNGRNVEFNLEADTPLLWALREELALTGTKFGCGIGVCGACTVHIDGAQQRACTINIGDLQARRITTIEGLAEQQLDNQPIGKLLQQAWIDHQVPQCGYCQCGMLMAAAALLQDHRAPTDADIDAAISNLCRCGTYPRVRAAIHAVAQAAFAVTTGDADANPVSNQP